MENPFKKLSKPQIYAVVIGGLAIGVYAEYRHHQSTGSWSPFATSQANGANGSGANAVSGTVTDPETGQVYSDTAQDPITGLTYSGEISQYGGVAAAETEYSSQYGATTGAVDVGGGASLPGYNSNLASVGTSTISGNDVYTSNSGWAQAATAGLTDVGYDGPTVSTALGAFLTGTPLTPAEVTIVNAAIAEYGRPPQGNIQVIQQPVAKPSPTPVPTPKPKPKTSGPVPNVHGESASAAAAHLAKDGFHNHERGVAGNALVESTVPKAGTVVPYTTTIKFITKGKLPETHPV